MDFPCPAVWEMHFIDLANIGLLGLNAWAAARVIYCWSQGSLGVRYDPCGGEQLVYAVDELIVCVVDAIPAFLRYQLHGHMVEICMELERKKQQLLSPADKTTSQA